MSISIIVLIMVFILIAVRKIGNINLPIWVVMLSGALAVLITQEITIKDALKSINIDVLVFLMCMFIIGESLHQSGYIYKISHRLFGRAKSVDSLIIFILLNMGILSAFLMNDTIAIIGTPLVIYFARKHKISPKLLLLTLCFAVTIGSSLSPIGNPQNLLVALGGNLKNPFVDFFAYLFVPTIINFFIAYFMLKFFYKKEFHTTELDHTKEKLVDPNLAFLCRISLLLIAILITLKIIFVIFSVKIDFRLTYIALISSLPILIFSPKRVKIAKNIDWSTLVFFASMFILMQSVWDKGFFQNILAQNHFDFKSIPVIFVISLTLSQFISNVPFVALYLPLLKSAGAGTAEMIALACGSTIAGNMFILGAASNIIIIQNAEKKGETIKFFEFAKIGIPLTIINTVIYFIFIKFFSFIFNLTGF
jgi:Na+/H+ antiporter NhaD/arsenite permease-like protein